VQDKHLGRSNFILVCGQKALVQILSIKYEY